MGIVASQLTGVISIQGAAQGKADLLSVGTASQTAQSDLTQLQNAAKDVSSILSSRMSAELKNAQSGLQDLAQRADAAGLDVSKFASLQMQAAESSARLGVAQAQAAAAMEKANLVSADASSSAEKVALAQSKATLAAENVKKAELAAGDAMSMVQGEATRLADAMGASGAKSSIFSTVMSGAREHVSGFFSSLAEAPGKLMELGQKFGFAVFGVEQLTRAFVGVGDAAGKMIGDFQQQMTKLVTTAGESQGNLKMVGDGILNMAGPTATAVKDLGDAAYWVESGSAHGSAALTDLKIAAMGAKAENANLTDVTKALMFTLNNFKDTGLTAAGAMNTLIAGVGHGEMTMQNLSTAISNVLPTAKTFGISLTDIVGGLDTMTMQGDDAAQSATHLAMMIKTIEAPSKAGADALHSVGLTTQQVTDEMRKSLPDAIDMIVKAMKAKFPEGSTAYNEALKAISGGSRSMAAIMETSGTQMDTFRSNVNAINDAVKKGGNSIAGWSDVQKNFNFRMDQAKDAVGAFGIKIATALAPPVGQLIGLFTERALPALSSFSDWFIAQGIPALQHFFEPLQTVGAWFQNFVGHGQAAIPIFAGIGAVIATVLVPAVWGLAAGVIAATWPFLAIGVAVGGLTAVFLHFYNTSADFRNFLTSTGLVLQQIGSFIAGVFTPVWEQLQDVWKSQLQPALQELWASFKQLQPELTIVGEIIGGVLLVSIGLLVESLGGIIGSIAGMAHGIAEIFGGIVQIVSGYIQIFTGFVAFIVDLFTGHFDKLGGDLKVILGGIGQIFSGFGNVLKGIVDGIVGGITGGFKGAATSIIGYLNDIVYGVNDKTKTAAIAAQIHTAEMKDKSIENAQKTNEGMQTHFIEMRNEIENQLKQTTDATQRHTLEMRLAAVNNALTMSQETGQKFVDMRYKSQEQIDLLKSGVDTSLMSTADKAKYHSLNMKDMYLGGVIDMDNQTIQKLDDMRIGIIQKLSQTKDEAARHPLEIQLQQVTADEKHAMNTKGVHEKARTSAESEMDKLKASSKQKHGDIIQDIKNIWGGIGNWFHGVWVGVQNIWGGIGAWFHDRWSEAWGGVTHFFGGIGKWFEDRWHDTQAIFGSIGQWFHDKWQEAWNGVIAFFGGIGHWFSDRWTEVMNSTKPFRDYMGDVFQTIWNILVAVWGKVSTWFHDRFTEAYNKVVEIWMPIGQWFGDRWKDVSKWFQGVGQWFHDRWMEAWNGTTWLFATLGKWFGDRWKDVQNIFGGIGQWFHDRWKEAWDKTVEIWTPIGKWFGDKWHDVQNILGGVGNWFHDLFQGAWNKVTQIWAPIGKWFSDTWDDVKKKTSDKWNEIKTDASNIFKGLINAIIDQLNNGISGIENFINFFGKGLDDIATSLGTKGTIPVAHLGRIAHYAEGTDDHPGGFAVMGERGPELAWMPKGSKVAPHDITELFLSMTGGKIPGYAGGIGDLGSQILGWISGGAKSILDGVMNSLHITAPNLPGMENLATGMFNKVKDWALSWVENLLPKFSLGGQAANIPGNVASWIATAMGITGVPASWANPLGVIAVRESGGNPAAVNLTDSNAQAGHPSQGLFQMIPSTFAAHMLPGHTNILNGIDSAISAIRYIQGRYGDVFHVPGILSLASGGPYVGYSEGGTISEPILGRGLRTGTNYAFGERGPELITPYVPGGVNLAAQQSSPTIHVHVHNAPPHFQVDGRTLARGLMPHQVDLIRYATGATI